MKNQNMLFPWLLRAALLTSTFLVAGPMNATSPSDTEQKGDLRFALRLDYGALVNPDGRALTQEDRQQAQKQATKVLLKRIEGAGARVAAISTDESTGGIILEIPGIGSDQRKQLEDLMTRPGYLEFRLVHENNAALVEQLLDAGTTPPGHKIVTVGDRRYYQKDPAFSGARDAAHKAQVANTGRVSPLFELMLERENVENHDGLFSPIYVEIRPELDGTAIQSARPQYDQYKRPEIALQLNKDGSKGFYRTTRDYAAGGLKNPSPMGRRLAIIVDDTLYSAPAINTVISGGSAVISGNFSMVEAAKLSNVLNSGAMPAPIAVEKIEFLQAGMTWATDTPQPDPGLPFRNPNKENQE